MLLQLLPAACCLLLAACCLLPAACCLRLRLRQACKAELALGYVLVGRLDEAKYLLKTVGSALHRALGPR